MNWARAESHGFVAALVAEQLSSPFITRLLSALLIAVISTATSKIIDRLLSKRNSK